jgi:hypothetical protein
MSSTSCVVLTYFVGYLIFCHIKVSQVKNLSTLLQRACQDDQSGHIICHIWSTREEVLNGDLSRSWEGRNPLKTRLIMRTDRKVALEGCRRHQKSREQSGGSAATRWGRLAPHVRLASLAPLPSGFPFAWWPPTDLYDASWPLFHVGLIRGLRFIPPGYKSRGRPPWGNQSIYYPSLFSSR